MSAELDRAFEALADPTRRRMVRLLGEAPRRSGELAALLTLSRPSASKHLAALREAGVVAEGGDPGDARARVYRLRPRAFRALRGWLDEVEACRGRAAACSRPTE